MLLLRRGAGDRGEDHNQQDVQDEPDHLAHATLAAATAAGIFLRCRYLMFSAAPPTRPGSQG